VNVKETAENFAQNTDFSVPSSSPSSSSQSSESPELLDKKLFIPGLDEVEKGGDL
jgi:hypothetical protein